MMCQLQDQREQDICQTHDDSVYLSTKIARNQSQRDTYGAGQQRTYNADKEGDTASVNKRAENIPSLTVGTENKPGVTSRLPCRRLVGIRKGERLHHRGSAEQTTARKGQ